MRPLLIWGASGHALVVADVALRNGWRVAAFVDDSPHARPGTNLHGVPVMGAFDARELLENGWKDAAVAIGHPRVRLAKGALLEGWGFRLPVLVHPHSSVAATALLGPGTFVAAGAVVNPSARLGRLNIINTQASVDHECELSDGIHICPGAHLAGSVIADEGVWVGIGASVCDHRRLGAWSFIGAGAAVVDDVQANALVVGVPARPRGSAPYAQVLS